MTFVTRATAYAVALALGVVLCSAAPAEAKLFQSKAALAAEAETLARIEAEGPSMTMLASSSTTIFAANATPCCTPCCPTPCIKYRNALLDFCKVKCCDPCAPPLKAVLHVVNPCTCCPVDVPVCLPSCCCGEPKMCCKTGLLGAKIVTYSWCCGVTVNVRFDKCGDVLVTYRGT